MRIAVVFGTRPEAIKVAPLVRALQADARFEVLPIVTAQHRDMLDQVLTLFGITPVADLDVQQHRQSLTDVTERVLRGLSSTYAELAPDLVVVQGDTTTTMAGAMAAFYARIPVAHLEAGLRTGDRFSPYPEEVNRRITTSLSDLHLPPTPGSRDNLLAEGVHPDSVVVTGNTVIDALQWTVRQPPAPDSDPGPVAANDRRRVVLVTAHRRESFGPPLVEVGRALLELVRSRPDLLVVLPMHRNPSVRDTLLPLLGGQERILLTEPLDYDVFARLMQRADLLLTDSGGVQEEGPSLGKPVLVMRETTERPEAIEYGTAKLVGTDCGAIVREAQRLLEDPAAYAEMANAVNPYGDGAAAQRCVDALAHHLGLSPSPATPFEPGRPRRSGSALGR